VRSRAAGEKDGIMMTVIGAILPFLMFILYDINSVKWGIAGLRLLFFAGSVLIVINTIAIIVNNYSEHSVEFLYLAPACLCLLMLMYALFFALPFQETYASGKNPSSLCRTGLYAMCRHPGALWFAGFYLFLSLMFPSRGLVLFSVLSCACNFLYVAFQDDWSFPRTFSDYRGYKKEVPFLLPTRSSFRKGLDTITCRGFGRT
jgi:protein-S-isoprenylcysteine O-methyltransferase Ste14